MTLFLALALWGSLAGAADTNPSPFDRNAILTTVTVIDGAAAAWTTYELATGRTSGLASGLTIVATGPAVALGAAVLKHDANDPALWVATVAAGAFFTVAAIDVMKRHLTPGVPYKPVDESGGKKGNFSMILVPRIEPLPNQASTRVGLALAGTF